MIRYLIFALLFTAAALYAARRYGWWQRIRQHPWTAAFFFLVALHISWVGATKPDPPEPPEPEPQVYRVNLWLDDQDRFILLECPLIKEQDND